MGGRSIGQVAVDLGVGKSTLGKWMNKHREADLLSGPHDDVQKELTRLRRENEILRQERDLLKKPRPSLHERQVDDVPGHRRQEGWHLDQPDMRTVWSQRQWLLRLETAAFQQTTAGRHGVFGPYPVTVYAVS
jgi:transposase